MAQAGQPFRSISSGISCSVSPKAMSQAPTAAMAATMFPVRIGAGARLMLQALDGGVQAGKAVARGLAHSYAARP